MDYRKFGRTYMVRIDAGEEVLQSLKALCEKEDIRLAQVDALGAADRAVVGVFDVGEQQYHSEELNGFMEITNLTGNVTRMNGEVYLHLHVTLVDTNHAAHGGHVNELRIGATCEMFVNVLDGETGRVRDEKIGLNLWDFAKE